MIRQAELNTYFGPLEPKRRFPLARKLCDTASPSHPENPLILPVHIKRA